MAVQLWQVADEGGFMYSPNLSKVMRRQAQARTKFRQFLDGKDGNVMPGMHNGSTFYWNVYENVAKRGTRLVETQPIPQTSFKLKQRNAIAFEYGNSVPYTGKLEAFAEHDIVAVIKQLFADDARKSFDYECFSVFKQTPLRVAPTGGNNATTVTLSTNGATAITNNIAMNKDHVKSIVDLMKTRNIPPFRGDDYYSITNVTTLRTFKDGLESLHQYVEMGLQKIMAGEIGRYEGCRFIEQNNIPLGGANDSTTFDPLSDVADPWNNGLSSWAFFFGADTGVEGIVIPEEIRAGIPSDFGRAKAIAWYALTAFGNSHPDATHSRVVMWDSAA
jgi:N4-gp56 family major capsid protein